MLLLLFISSHLWLKWTKTKIVYALKHKLCTFECVRKKMPSALAQKTKKKKNFERWRGKKVKVTIVDKAPAFWHISNASKMSMFLQVFPSLARSLNWALQHIRIYNVSMFVFLSPP